jgi:ABC-type Fe3+/spermidine/putrescine transport system ATPase subunit
LLQVGTPEEIFCRPVNEFVARFTRAENIWRGEIRSQTGEWAQVWLNGASLWVQLPEGHQLPKGEVAIVVRPERVRLLPAAKIQGEQINSLSGEISAMTDKGAFWKVEVSTEVGIPVVVLVSKREAEQMGLALGQLVSVAFDPSFIHLCPASGTFAERVSVLSD